MPCRVDPGVEDRVDDHAQLHLELLHPQRAGIALARVPLLRHDPFGVDRPALGERAGPQRRPDRGVRAGEPARVLELQVVAGHGLVHHQVVHHVPVVLAVERGDPLRRPVGRRRRDRDERGQRRRLERAGGVAVGHRDPAVDLRHRDQLDRVVVDRDQAAVGHEGGLRGQGVPAELQDGGVVRHVPGQPVEDLPDHAWARSRRRSARPAPRSARSPGPGRPRPGPGWRPRPPPRSA